MQVVLYRIASILMVVYFQFLPCDDSLGLVLLVDNSQMAKTKTTEKPKYPGHWRNFLDRYWSRIHERTQINQQARFSVREHQVFMGLYRGTQAGREVKRTDVCRCCVGKGGIQPFHASCVF